VQAPSAVNEQPWTFTVVRDQALLDQLSHDAKTHMLTRMPPSIAAGAQAEHFRVMLGDSDVSDLLSRTGADCHFREWTWFVYRGGLRSGGAESDAAGPFPGTRQLLDRLAQSYLGTPAGRKTLGFPARACRWHRLSSDIRPRHRQRSHARRPRSDGSVKFMEETFLEKRQALPAFNCPRRAKRQPFRYWPR